MKKSIWVLSLFFIVGICNGQTTLWQATDGPYTRALYQGSTADSSGNLFVGMEEGGIFRSTDKGVSWKPNYFINSVIGRMKADQFGNVFACDLSGGILRTTDGGNNWTYQNNGLPSGAEPVSFTAFGDSGFIVSTYPPGLYFTTNQGQSWVAFSGLAEQSGRIGAVTELASGNILVGSLDSGMFRSTENGRSWRKVDSFPLSSNSWIYDIKVLRTGRILVATEYNGVYKSDDDGLHWSLLLSSQVNYFEFLGTVGPNEVYACSAIDGVYRSFTNGDSWEYWGPYNQAIRSMVCYSNDDVYIFAAGCGALVRRAGSVVWDTLYIPSLAVSTIASRGNTVYVGAYPDGFFRTTDGGQSWNQSSLNQAFCIQRNKSGDLFASVWGGRVWKSSDDGNSWYQALKATLAQPDGYSIAIDSSGDIFAGIGADYYAGYGGTIFKSTNNGNDWQETNQGLGEGSVLSLLATDNNTILATNNYNGVYRSTDSGASWQPSSSGLPPSSNFISQTLAKDVEGRIFCGTTQYGVFISTDDGVSWQPSNSGLSALDVTGILPVGGENTLLSTTTGIFQSTDNGANWHRYDNGISNVCVTSLAVDSLGYVYAGTNGIGVYKSVHSITEVKEVENLLPASYHLSNYPNPFNPSTTIEWSIPQTVIVHISIYDAIGEKVATLVDAKLPRGDYKVQWGAREVASGIYFCRMETGSFVRTIKLMFLK